MGIKDDGMSKWHHFGTPNALCTGYPRVTMFAELWIGTLRPDFPGEKRLDVGNLPNAYFSCPKS